MASEFKPLVNVDDTAFVSFAAVAAELLDEDELVLLPLLLFKLLLLVDVVVVVQLLLLLLLLEEVLLPQVIDPSDDVLDPGEAECDVPS